MRSIPPKSLELISEFSKFIGYKANIQESIVFIYVYMYTHTYVCVCKNNKVLPPRRFCNWVFKRPFEVSGSQNCGGWGATWAVSLGSCHWSACDHLHSLSPLEQQTFPYYFSKGIPSMLCSAQMSSFCIILPFVAFYLVYTWGTQEFETSKRKNPASYENDKWATHLEDGSLSIKDTSLGEECTR